MGIIKAGLMAGTAYMALDKVSKAHVNNEQERFRQQQLLQQQQPQQYQYQPMQGSQRQVGFGHVSWCNGSCNGQCMEGQNPPQYAYGNQMSK